MGDGTCRTAPLLSNTAVGRALPDTPECREELAVSVEPITALGTVQHAYSHFSVTLHPFLCALHGSAARIVAESATDVRWISRAEIADLPFPKATLKVFDSWQA